MRRNDVWNEQKYSWVFFSVFCTTIVNDIYVLDSDSIQLNQMLLPKHHYRVPPIVGQQGCTKFRRGWLIVMVMSQKSIAIFGKKQWLLSIDMKTKVDQHVPRIIFHVLKVSSFQVFKFSVFKFSKHSWFPAFVWHSDIFSWEPALWTLM